MGITCGYFKNEKSGNNAAQSCVVTALGFKPKTF